MGRTADVVLTDEGAFAAWAEDEGWLDDSVVLQWRQTVDGIAITMGLQIRGEDDAFSGTERLFKFRLTATDGSVTPSKPPKGAFEVRALQRDGAKLVLALHFHDADVRVTAREFRVRGLGEVTRKVAGVYGNELTFHGPGPVLLRDMKASVAATGCAFFANWKSSGQSFGRAFAAAAPDLAGDGELDGAIRVVPGGSQPDDARGLWLVGNSIAAGAYVTVQSVATTDAGLLRAVVHGLATVAGLTWASSGNRRVMTAADRDRWLRSVASFLSTPR